MIHIAVAEDEHPQRELLKAYLERFRDEYNVPVFVHLFQDGDELLEAYTPGKYDILLLDIQMKRLDGMTTAEEIRKTDDTVIILFITNLVHYAIRGYSVRALDFIVKPVQYELFVRKMETAVDYYRKKEINLVRFKTLKGTVNLERSDILYIELVARKLYIQTRQKQYQCNSTIQNAEEKLADRRFFRCHAAVLVNLEHVRAVEKDYAEAGVYKVPVSKHRRKEFLDALTAYLGGDI